MGPAGITAEEAFMRAVAPSGVGKNEYYKTQEEYLHVFAAAMHEKYRATSTRAFRCRSTIRFAQSCSAMRPRTPTENRKPAQMYVDAVSHSLRGFRPTAFAFTLVTAPEGLGRTV